MIFSSVHMWACSNLTQPNMFFLGKIRTGSSYDFPMHPDSCSWPVKKNKQKNASYAPQFYATTPSGNDCYIAIENGPVEIS